MEITSLLDHTDAFFPHEPNFYFSHPSHGGILWPTDTSFSPSAAHTDKHFNAHTRLWHPLSHKGDTPSLFKCTQSPFTRQKNPHKPHPRLDGSALSIHTHTLFRLHTDEHLSEAPPPPSPPPPSAYWLSVWLVPLCAKVLLLASRGAAGAWMRFVRPQDGGLSRVLRWKALKSFIWNGYAKFTEIIF